MSLYNIHFCKKNELNKLQHFINNHWRHGHVMGTSKELMDFQHEHEGSDYYDFAVAENNETGEFDAIYGFIRSWKYDTTHTVPSIGWGAIWKVREDADNPEIGSISLKLMKYILINGDIDVLGSLGISKDFKAVAKSLHFTVGTMNHYYIANSQFRDYRVIVNPKFTHKEVSSNFIIKQFDRLNSLGLDDNSLNPTKNLCYFTNRYEKHPFYNYLFWGVYEGAILQLLFVVRKIKVGEACLYRIIDAIGNKCASGSIIRPIQQILQEAGAEYIDCMNTGIDPDFFDNLGFEINDKNETIIPEHLNPLEHKNIPLEYAYSDGDSLVIFKGDGDQDRPNSWEELCKKN